MRLTLHVAVESADECCEVDDVRGFVLCEDGLARCEVAQVTILGGEEDKALVRVLPGRVLLGDHRLDGLAHQTRSTGDQHNVLSRSYTHIYKNTARADTR
jgi:hypothetical protein